MSRQRKGAKNNRRDRRDASRFRREVEAAGRRRDVERRTARRIKQQALVYEEVAVANASFEIAGAGPTLSPPQFPGTRPNPMGGAAHLGTGKPSGGTHGAFRVCESVVPGRGQWLPAAGGIAMIDGIRVSAVPVDAAPGHPFYVLASIDREAGGLTA